MCSRQDLVSWCAQGSCCALGPATPCSRVFCSFWPILGALRRDIQKPQHALCDAHTVNPFFTQLTDLHVLMQLAIFPIVVFVTIPNLWLVA